MRITSTEFDSVLKRGKTYVSPSFSLSFSKSLALQLAIVVSKKVSKKAVVRNKNRRRVRHAIKKLEKELSTGAFIIFLRKDLSRATFSDIEKEIRDLLLKV